MQFFKRTSLFIFVISFFVMSFTTSIKNQRTIEGRIINQVTQEPVAVEIVIYRQGQAWHVKSTDKGWYAISLPTNQAYAVKIYQNEFKNHVSVFYLDIDSTNKSYEHNIMLLPATTKTE